MNRLPKEKEQPQKYFIELTVEEAHLLCHFISMAVPLSVAGAAVQLGEVAEADAQMCTVAEALRDYLRCKFPEPRSLEPLHKKLMQLHRCALGPEPGEGVQ